MAIYRVFCMDETSAIKGVEVIEAETDEEAVQIARDLDYGVRCDVWTPLKFIAAIDPRACGRRSN